MDTDPAVSGELHQQFGWLCQDRQLVELESAVRNYYDSESAGLLLAQNRLQAFTRTNDCLASLVVRHLSSPESRLQAKKLPYLSSATRGSFGLSTMTTVGPM